MKMCFEVLLLSAHDHLLNDIPNLEKNCLELGLSKILAESRCGILKEEQDIIYNSSDTKFWIIDYTGRNQPFLVVVGAGSIPCVIVLD